MIILGAQFLSGMIYGQWLEWFLHKNLLHKIGKKRGSAFSYHFHKHHRTSRQHLFRDHNYEQHGIGMRKEIRDLGLLFVLHLPLLFVVPFFLAGSVLQAILYFTLHRKAHLDPEWCKRHLPWHYDHHMAPNQDANWGVTTDWIDRIMGTKQVYLGTEKERRDTIRRQKNLVTKPA